MEKYSMKLPDLKELRLPFDVYSLFLIITLLICIFWKPSFVWNSKLTPSAYNYQTKPISLKKLEQINQEVNELWSDIQTNTKTAMDYFMILMQGKLIQRCTHFLYCSVLSLGWKVNTRRISEPDEGGSPKFLK